MITQEIARRLGFQDQAWAMIQLLRWPAVFAVLTVAVAILYRYGPSIVIPWRWIVTGAAFFTLGWLIATAVLAGMRQRRRLRRHVRLARCRHRADARFYVTSALLLVGAEITAALARERSPDEILMRGEERAVAEKVSDTTEGATERVRGEVDRVT